jgi:hypothetical protein
MSPTCARAHGRVILNGSTPRTARRSSTTAEPAPRRAAHERPRRQARPAAARARVGRRGLALPDVGRRARALELLRLDPVRRRARPRGQDEVRHEGRQRRARQRRPEPDALRLEGAVRRLQDPPALPAPRARQLRRLRDGPLRGAALRLGRQEPEGAHDGRLRRDLPGRALARRAPDFNAPSARPGSGTSSTSSSSRRASTRGKRFERALPARAHRRRCCCRRTSKCQTDARRALPGRAPLGRS